MNKEAIDLLIQKSPRLKRDRAKLEAMQPGAYCVHRAWGLGQIKEYDEMNNRLIIDFVDNREGHAMDPSFCVDKLEILADDDLLVRSQTEPETIERLIKQEPTELIKDILKRAEEHKATALEIETILSRVMGNAKFKKWWTQTRKALVKDPMVSLPTKKTDPYELREEALSAEDEVLEEFSETKAPKKKINLAAKLIELSVEHKDIEQELPEILRELTDSLAETKQLNPGERLHGIWVRNDLARFIEDDPEKLEPTSASIIIESNETNSLSTLADQIPATHYARYLDLIQRTLPDHWEKAIFEILKNSSGKLTGECINFLNDNDLRDKITKTFERWLVEQNLKAPVLMWILKNRSSKRYESMLSDLMTPRLLGAIFFAIDYEALQNASTRRIPLAEIVGDDQELIGDLLAEANYETAHDLAQTLMLNQGFEDLSKKSLLARFIRKFPSIQAIVAGEGGSATQAADDLVVSDWSFQERKKEYELLVSEKIPKNKEDIAEARAHGDLKENSEYKMARQEQDVLLSRKNELEVAINKARVTDFTDAKSESVSIGSVVELVQSSNQQTVSYSILGAWDSKPEENILSYQTPLARAILGKSEGDQVIVEIDGHEEAWTVRSISRWVDQA